jgi:hypothetical protein
MNLRIANKVNTLAVSIYKTLGTVLLSLILVGLVSYLGLQTFFFVSHGWLTPTVVSPTDPEILQLNAQLAQQAAARDKLLADKRDLEARLEQAERVLGSEEDFQERFRVALGSERKARARSLRRLAALRREYQQAAGEIAESNRAYAGMERTRTEALYNAKLMEREQRLTANHQLAQLAQTNLSLAEGSTELQTKLEAVKRELAGFDASMAGKAEGLTAEVLLLEREYTRSVLEAARAKSEREHLKDSLRALNEAVGRYDALLATIRSSPWLEAFEKGLAVGFVPYDNLENAPAGTPLYQCALRLLWCREVGVVGHPLQGEVTVKHPVRQTLLRGVMVELQLQDERWAHEELLHLGRPPLLL